MAEYVAMAKLADYLNKRPIKENLKINKNILL